MQRKKILIPIGKAAKNLKGVHYALALAERLQAQIYIVQHDAASGVENHPPTWLDRALLDLINNARQAGMVVSHYMAKRNMCEKIVDLVRAEHIDLLVFSTDEDVSESLLNQVKSLVPSQIIQVREKDNIRYI